MTTTTVLHASAHVPARARADATPRNAGIDYLRGLAILLVVIHHLALPFRLPLRPSLLGARVPKRLIDAVSFNGYESVFIFFVISGFLITSRILERDGALHRVGLRRFYTARAVRILPLLGIVLGVLTVLALALLPLRSRVPVAAEVWWEKAYLPWMSAIAWGVLAALLARHWRPGPRTARWLALAGVVCIALLGGVQTRTFTVYLPVLVCCFFLARGLERATARLLPRS